MLHEHEAILFALKILSNINRKLETATSVGSTDLSDFVGFLKELADKCHHGKEEGLLFPALAASVVQEAVRPFGMLLKQHAEGRRWMAEMSAAIEPVLSAFACIRAAHGYTELLRAHIDKENDVLFPMAERVLSPERLESLNEAFEEHESKAIGQGRHEELHARIKSLKSKYSAA